MEERQKITRFNGISNWLSNSVSESEDKRYTHRLLREDKSQRDVIIDELILIVQKAHEDARFRLRRLAGNSLAPFGDFSENDPSEGYPDRLNIISLQGYFGEIFSGIIAENFAHFGQDDWEVPAFLFRFHLVEFQHLEILNQTEEIAKKRPGRTGDDCLAFRRNSEGVIIASLVCEAKCTTNHYTKMIAEAHEKASEPHIRPVDIPQIIDILQDYNDSLSYEWINCLRVLWLEKVDTNYERCDLISYICGEHPVRNKTWISLGKPHEQYTAERRIEAVEIHLHEVENLVTTVYSQPASATPSVNISTQTVIVTGLYGGTDWGLTDVWLTSEQPTVLICTYEKAEALMKFLGALFIRRISLIVIDEAHAVQFDGNKDSLQKSENRSLRLESLSARLFTYVEENHSRIIALSAVASETETALASWIENQNNATPAKTYYRSTRQLIGRLECLAGRGFEIRYDLLDGRKLGSSVLVMLNY